MDTLKNSLYPGASDASVAMVLGYCRAAALDPMKKPVHIVPIWSKAANGMVDTIMPGIALYRIMAARTGEYAGKSEPEFGPDKTISLGGVQTRFPEWCRVTVRRLVNGQMCEFHAKEYWLENYATAKRDSEEPNAMWKKRAYGQLAKCAEAQALRMAFPEQTGGTNTDDEMQGKTFDLTPETPVVQIERPRHPDYVADYRGGLAQTSSVQGVMRARKAWARTVGEAETNGNPIPEDIQNQIAEMIDARQDELADRFAREEANHAHEDRIEVPA
ncbi:phage recombination protein Bet [Brytella acorum]|uniref:Phage recombination protein Bet n=1 Tax=Brytella acorum TaxID=2959299 RepID=A0AA35Y0E3_9PROT|nr:phage recombination protein Bet [Brytella acorum]CAI9119569.1 phage recombination protein Bet [Brytella acorum]